jgi:hypothetical protein
VCLGTSNVTTPQSILTAGAAGSGGTSSGNAGAPGVASRALDCNFF